MVDFGEAEGWPIHHLPSIRTLHIAKICSSKSKSTFLPNCASQSVSVLECLGTTGVHKVKLLRNMSRNNSHRKYIFKHPKISRLFQGSQKWATRSQQTTSCKWRVSKTSKVAWKWTLESLDLWILKYCMYVYKYIPEKGGDKSQPLA